MVTFGKAIALRNESGNFKELASITGKSDRTVERALKKVGYGYEPTQKIWTYQGDGEAPDNEEIPTNVPTNKQTKKPTNEPTNDNTNEPTREPSNMSKEPTNVVRKRSSFDIDVELMKDLKIYAIQNDQNVYEIVEQAIKAYLKR